MDASNRSKSVLTFSPGVHRRSYPNLQHLSLAPLTPQYPITPSDYNAYVDPHTSQLQTSSSLSHIASMPSPSGILSQSDDRANSRARYQKSKNRIPIEVASSAPRGALTSQGFGGQMTDLAGSYMRRRSSGGSNSLKKTDSTWLLHAGTALTEGSRESKGQSWLAKRASSTSLHSPATYDYPSSEYAQAGSGRGTPTHSRRGSRERRKSRRELAMTPTPMTIFSKVKGTAADKPSVPREVSSSISTHDYLGVEPDWADSLTQAKVVAGLETELADGLEDGELYPDDGDRYGALGFKGQGIEDEEREIQQTVQARGFGLGRWIDGVVDAFLKLDEADEEGLEIEHGMLDHDVLRGPEADTKEDDVSGEPKGQDVDDAESDDEMEPAPRSPKSVWEDLVWFGRLILRTAKS